jgi:hypothetical protein
VISACLVNKLIPAPGSAYARMLAPSWAAALVAGAGALWLYDRLPFAKAAWNLMVAGLILVLLYALLTWLVDHQLRDALRMALTQVRAMAAARRKSSVRQRRDPMPPGGTQHVDG